MGCDRRAIVRANRSPWSGFGLVRLCSPYPTGAAALAAVYRGRSSHGPGCRTNAPDGSQTVSAITAAIRALAYGGG
jgi:hypothetical protein